MLPKETSFHSFCFAFAGAAPAAAGTAALFAEAAGIGDGELPAAVAAASGLKLTEGENCVASTSGRLNNMAGILLLLQLVLVGDARCCCFNC